jgi:hypothetical protein
MLLGRHQIMNLRKWSAWMTDIGLLLIACVLAGCDTDSANNPVDITPNGVTMKMGESQEFTASGGYTYQWELDDESIGALSPRTGDKVVYTVTSYQADRTQKIKVTSTIPESSSTAPSSTSTSSVNAAYYSVTATAIVHQNPTKVFAIHPSDEQKVSTAANEPLIFYVEGGVPQYTWSLSEPSLGSLAPFTSHGQVPSQASDAVLYTPTALSGVNYITCIDGESHTVKTRITQTAPGGNGLTVTPSQASVTRGQVVVFKVSGGTAPYTWTCSNNSGSIASTLDGTATAHYLAADQVSGMNNVICTDSAGRVGIATVLNQGQQP